MQRNTNSFSPRTTKLFGYMQARGEFGGSYDGAGLV
jgi:hypothetical protein